MDRGCGVRFQQDIEYALDPLVEALEKARKSKGVLSVYALGGSTGFERWVKVRAVKQEPLVRGRKSFLWLQEAEGLAAWFCPHDGEVVLSNYNPQELMKSDRKRGK